MENSNSNSNSEEMQPRNVSPLVMRVDEGWADSIRNPSQFADPGLERWVSQPSNPSTPVVFYVKNRNIDQYNVHIWVYQNGKVQKLPGSPGSYVFNEGEAESARVLCTNRCALVMNVFPDHQTSDPQLRYDIDRFDFVAEKSKWERVIPPFITTDTPEAFYIDSDASKTYIWGATQVQKEYIDTDADAMSDGDGSRQVWKVYDPHGWILWSHDTNDQEMNDQEEWWKTENPYNSVRTNEDFPYRPPKYLEISRYMDSSKTLVMESLYKRYQLTQYAMFHNPHPWAPESKPVGDILIFQDHKSPQPVTALYTMSQSVPGRPLLERTIYKAELQNGWSVKPNVADWDAFQQKWRACIGKNTVENNAMKLFWDAQKNTEQNEWSDRPLYRWEREFGFRDNDSFGSAKADDLQFYVTQRGPIYVYGFVGEQSYSTGDPKKKRIAGNNFNKSFPVGHRSFNPRRLEVTDEDGSVWTVLDSGSAQECLDQTTYPSES